MKIDAQYPRENIGASMPSHEIVAAYMKDLACRGKGCASNNSSIASVTGLTVSAVKRAKERLIADRRLIGAWSTWVSIDGYRFGQVQTDDIERLKDTLRRRYSPVCDARTVTRPNSVPSGPPIELKVGERIMTLAEAFALAASMGVHA